MLNNYIFAPKSKMNTAKINTNKYNTELQRTDPGTKVTGEFSTKGRICPSNALNGFLLFPSFYLEKYTLK